MAKSRFSHLIDLVKQGQTVLITERNRPVATLQPVPQSSSAGLESIHGSGLLKPPGRNLDVAAFLAAPRAALAAEDSLTQAVLSEREEGR
jgi:prevent-host-death family protein